MLQMVFVLTFIVLAPFVGQIADSFPKGRAMLLPNACAFGAVGDPLRRGSVPDTG